MTDRRERVHDGTESGVGRIWSKGEVVVEAVEYTISHSHTQLHYSTMTGAGSMRGTGAIDGQLHGRFSMKLIGEPVELELEDGRRWKCFIQSSDGNLMNMGGISEPPK